jgi:hypothetical protein
LGVTAEPLQPTAAAAAQRLDVPLPGEVAYVHVASMSRPASSSR